MQIQFIMNGKQHTWEVESVPCSCCNGSRATCERCGGTGEVTSRAGLLAELRDEIATRHEAEGAEGVSDYLDEIDGKEREELHYAAQTQKTTLSDFL